MANLEYGGLLFRGKLIVTLSVADDPYFLEGALENPGRAGLARFGTRRGMEKFWIGPPKIRFEGAVVACGQGDPSSWEVGLLQSISHATWTGHYTHGEQLRFRLNTDRGGLKDGDADSLFFRYPVDLRKSSSDCYEAAIEDADSTQATFWLEYSDDPYHPQTDRGNGLGRLIRTEGEWRFRTFLAVVHSRDRVVLTLAESHWTLIWDGDYDHAAKVWKSIASGEMIAHQEYHQAARYQNIAAEEGNLPFSLYLDTAPQSWQVWTPDGWVMCRECRPRPEPPDQPMFKKWGQ